MSWPNTVSLITGTVGDSLGSSGESADRIYVAVTPVFGDGVHRLLHAATGTVWDDRAVVTSGTPGLFVQVPHVDQTGFVDGAGNEVTDWYYLVQVITRAGTGKSQWSYYWQPRTADGDTIDLDTLGDGVLVTDPVLVYTPARDAADAREAAAQALASAQAADESRTDAAGSAHAADLSAQAADLSAQNAATSVIDAMAAQNGAEAAESNAEDQAAAAGTSAGQAAGSSAAAQTARTGAETAKTGAESALAAVPAAVASSLATDPTPANAAAAAVATALGTAGVLAASTSPALDTTRVPDPQAKTSGGSASGVQMPLTRITSGLPTVNGSAIAFGIETTRAGTLSAIISQIYFGSTTSTDPLRIPVTAGEVLTAAAYGWTDQASSKARMDVNWYGASGFISTSAGTYSNIVTSTWEQRVITATAPTGATYCTPQFTSSTQSGSTVTGAKGRATACLVVSGTVASPVYVDGEMHTLGWYWSGTAHASTGKKAQFLLSDVETPAGSAAKVAAHAAAADPHTVYFKKALVPTLAMNRAVDPQLVTTGASASSPSYPLTRITSGLPTVNGQALTSGIETTRAGTLSGIIAQAYLAPPSLSQADALRIPVTPAEVISVSALMWTDQSNARARLDLIYWDASGVLIGSTVAGTYSSIAASTWETRSQVAVTVPALAAYVTPQATVAVNSGGGNTVTGAKARATGVMVVSGTALATYADGTFTTQGWDWSGTANASQSVKKVTSAAEQAAAAGGLSLTKSGAALALARTFGATGTLVQNLSLTGSSNGAFNIVSTTLNGVTVHANGDDICPIRTQLGTVGANHGYTGCVAGFSNPDGKTTADLGSVWQDTAGREYVLFAIIGGVLYMGGSYTSPGGVTTAADVAPATNLTHVSGATHTGAIAFGTKTAVELLPVIQRATVTLWADGRPVTADGTISAHEVVVRESYAILDYASIYDTAKANVGVPYSTLTVATAVRVSNTYRWTMGGCRVTQTLTELRPTTLAQTGGVQAFSLAETAGTLTRYLPGVGVIGGNNWGTGVAMASYSTDQLVTTSNLVTATRPAAFALDVLDNTGTVLIGFAVGYLPYGARGDEASTSANRLTKAPTKLWDLRGSKKLYPTFTAGETAGWGHLTVEAVRAYLDPTAVAAVLASKGDAASAWEALNANANLAAA